jgi:hypothetical protein
MAFESIPNTGAGGKGSAGIRAEMLAFSKEADMVLTGYRHP